MAKSVKCPFSGHSTEYPELTCWSGAVLNIYVEKLSGSAREADILDSGATHTLCGSRSDFKWIEPTPSVEVAGIDGVVSTTPTGSIGCLKHNTLGLSRAVYYPALGEKRLISVSDVNEQGWAVYMDQKESAIKRGGGKRRIWWQNNLPRINLFPFEPQEAQKKDPPTKDTLFLIHFPIFIFMGCLRNLLSLPPHEIY